MSAAQKKALTRKKRGRDFLAGSTQRILIEAALLGAGLDHFIAQEVARRVATRPVIGPSNYEALIVEIRAAVEIHRRIKHACEAGDFAALARPTLRLVYSRPVTS